MDTRTNTEFLVFVEQTGGKALVMEAEATAQLQKQGVLPTDDKAKYIWHKVNVLRFRHCHV